MVCVDFPCPAEKEYKFELSISTGACVAVNIACTFSSGVHNSTLSYISGDSTNN